VSLIGFEVIEVRHDHSHGLTASNAALGFPAEQVHDRATIPKPGQMIMRCLELQLAVSFDQRPLQFQNSFTGTQAGAQFGHVKRFGQVVIGSRLQSGNYVLFAAFGGKQQHIFIGTWRLAANSAAQFDSDQAGHYPIQDCHLGRIVLLQPAPRVQTIVHGSNLLVPFLQPVLQDSTEDGIVLGNQDGIGR
jgi:hypothetical protein